MELPFAITLAPDTGLRNKTGSWRSQQPQYVSLLAPCNHACPAGENIQQWLYHAEEGRYEAAWRVIMQDNAFPAIHGRVCYHNCENECNREKMTDGGGAVSIHAVERFLGDLAIEKGWDVRCAAATHKKIMVIGSGPCGLSCAYHLARLGHSVTVCEAGKQLGGMMRFGIPAYRLPRNILDAEINRIARMGVKFITNMRIGEATFNTILQEFDAAFLGIGAGAGKHADIPASQAGKIIDAITFLQKAAEGKSDMKIGRRVAIYGGGNTAMDAARVAKRLGAEETVIVYRRDRAHAPAHDDEIQEALDEGVVVHWLRTIKALDGEELKVEVMRLDDKGKPQPTGEYETLQADTIILAVGQDPQSEWLKAVPGLIMQQDGSIEIDEHMMTGCPGLFAGGDMVTDNRTVTTAVGHGKKAARNIDAHLKRSIHTPKPEPAIADFDKLNTWYYTDAPKSLQPQLDRLRRTASFDETVGGLDETTALYEARRCLSCGNCFGCDNCYGLCPDNAIVKVGTAKFKVNLDYCKGCGLCAEECPCGAIEMVNEAT
jgi:2-oxoacid:acceptor oxidoreductase delta subunit (pyruvate/2-ketoisovalerate family)